MFLSVWRIPLDLGAIWPLTSFRLFISKVLVKAMILLERKDWCLKYLQNDESEFIFL